MINRSWDLTVDLLVVGAGAAGMTAALVASLEGLDVLLCEKSNMVGGVASTSAGTVWIPGSRQSAWAGVPDSVEAARTYLNSVIRGNEGVELREAFLQSGPAVLDYLEENTDVAFAAATAHPDYLGNRPGAAFGGRALGTLPFDGRSLGDDFIRVRPPRSEFMAFGGMMVGKADLPLLLKPFGSMRAFLHVARMVARYMKDLIRYRRGTRLIMGNALVARLLMSLKRLDVPIRYDAPMRELIAVDGAVVGAVIADAKGDIRVRARRGVVLATGGIGWSRHLREEMFPNPVPALSLASPEIAGDGIDAACGIGAILDDATESAGLWMPCSVLTKPDGTTSVYPHIVLDRAKPGLIAVNSAGRRFVNEANSYHDFCVGMLKSNETVPSVPSFLVCDRRFIHDYGIGLVLPGTTKLKRFIEAGYLIEAETIAALAIQLKIDPGELGQSVGRYNRHAAAGVDEDFGRGSTDLNRINGDPANGPNPCLREIGPGPFYAVAVYPADLASSAGIATDENGRVIAQSGGPVPGLYACGNDSVSVFRGTYPGPGATLGPALVFGWRVAMHAARHEYGSG
ncbi:FAD-dependent oxidoreductase [Rhodopseudomonas sp. P2A-2r]|uniref:FAD-dependent oxidoreductase n=1 Tax=Rhodopseudomonas sp. P2A-2r TaxID=2991972 RepID=UPI002234CD7C|nr:FAD-dependent oxidoreductase [Rhodopseudomonas sp. P2A-2r]UZE52073.1 FAD-dependent oxidoreductase [Rhodopseudomonas sp. P2A-2r]